MIIHDVMHAIVPESVAHCNCAFSVLICTDEAVI